MGDDARTRKEAAKLIDAALAELEVDPTPVGYGIEKNVKAASRSLKRGTKPKILRNK